MRSNRCVKCAEDFLADYKSNVCGECEIEKEIGFPALKETVSLHTMQNVSKARVNELDRRVQLPEKIPGTDHNYIGTRIRGKTSDKAVDIRP